jgi:primosomal protein N' (replication factor Y)
VPRNGLFPLDYQTDLQLAPGQLVIVPLRAKHIVAIVYEVNPTLEKDVKLRSIERVLEGCVLPRSMLELIHRASEYYLASLGSVAKLVLPVEVEDKEGRMLWHELPQSYNLATLAPPQQEALDIFCYSTKPVLLQGVTGSGKTEIYFHALVRELIAGKQVVILLPEIALSKQIIARFTQRLGFEPAIWNSKVSMAKKCKILRGIINGDIKVVIGARSALFLPYKNLGIIIVDEEHDSSYKQNEGVPYHARDMAVLRAHIEKSKLMLVSATPSIESLYNARINKYSFIEIGSRFNEASMPHIEIIDMRSVSIPNDQWLSPEVLRKINYKLEKQEQILIFLNRRGYAPLLLCKSCGYRANCKDCSSSMVVHKSKRKLQCHHCDNMQIMPERCPQCSQGGLILCGPGIERIAEEVAVRFPNARIATVSREISSNKEMDKLLEEMANGQVDIIIGTQVITKGYHFPKMTLVIVVDADLGLGGGDLRVGEKTLQLLQQVAGRAGREHLKGEVLIQTYFPDHKVIESMRSCNMADFIEHELSSRLTGQMPPFSRVATINFSGKNDERTKLVAKKFLSMAPMVHESAKLRVFGPAAALMHKLSGKYRYKILVIAKKNFPLQQYLTMWLESVKSPPSISIKIDIDPQIMV